MGIPFVVVFMVINVAIGFCVFAILNTTNIAGLLEVVMPENYYNYVVYALILVYSLFYFLWVARQNRLAARIDSFKATFSNLAFAEILISCSVISTMTLALSKSLSSSIVVGTSALLAWSIVVVFVAGENKLTGLLVFVISPVLCLIILGDPIKDLETVHIITAFVAQITVIARFVPLKSWSQTIRVLFYIGLCLWPLSIFGNFVLYSRVNAIFLVIVEFFIWTIFAAAVFTKSQKADLLPKSS
ncbi:MAG: hypothetical protein ACRESZ_10715 [Methylococcales bacterium]